VARAICLRCGAAKRQSTTACKSCGLDPRGDPRVVAQSHLLSIDRYEDGTDRKRYARELDDIADRIRAGEQVTFEESEIEREIEVIELGKRLTWRHGCRAFGLVMLWLAPLWLIIGVAIWLFLRR